jgi:hypothetical protein
MIRALIAKITLLFLLLSSCAAAQTMDEAVQTLSRKVAARVPAGTAIRVTSRNLSSLPASDATRAQSQLDRALRRRVPRQAPVAEVRLTVSESAREFLLVAEIMREGARDVELAPFRVETPARRALPALERRLLFEQDSPLLDAVPFGESLFVLDADKLQRLERREGRWESAGLFALSAPPVRDARGRLEVAADAVNVFLPGLWCQGPWQPALALTCENRPAEFTLQNLKWHFSAGRNTMENPAWPPVYSYAQARSVQVAAEADGVARLYDADRRPLGLVEDWGSDLAAMCDGRILAVRAVPRLGIDAVALFTLSEGKAVEASEPLEFPGAVTAVWPNNGGAVVIAHHAQTGRYAAYSVTANCSR